MEPSPIVEGQVTAQGRKVAVVAARFNDFIVSSLLKGATASWLEHGGAAEDLLVARVPDAFDELAEVLAVGFGHVLSVTELENEVLPGAIIELPAIQGLEGELSGDRAGAGEIMGGLGHERRVPSVTAGKYGASSALQARQQVRHLQRRIHGLAALIAFGGRGTLESLFDRLDGENTEYHGDAGLQGHQIQAPRALPSHILEVRRVATNDAA